MSVKEFVEKCSERRWQVIQEDGQHALIMVPSLKVNCTLRCAAYFDKSQLTWCTWLPVGIPPARRVHVLALINELNWALFEGNFEIDGSFQMLSFRTSCPTPRGRITEAAFQALADVNIARVEDLFFQIAIAARGQVA